MIKKPRKNRIIGEEPPLALNSLKAKDVINAPRTKPVISGLIYCAPEAWCSPSAPVISRMKQVTVNPLFSGLPQFVNRAAKAPVAVPAIMSLPRVDNNLFHATLVLIASMVIIVL
jgi:hypothetical protein